MLKKDETSISQSEWEFKLIKTDGGQIYSCLPKKGA